MAKVKIDTATEWDDGNGRKQYGPGSVIDVPVEVYELNSSWMKLTDEDLKAVPVAAAKKPTE